MGKQSAQWGRRIRTSIGSTLLAAASIPLALQAPALAATHGFPPEGSFDCDSSSGIWQHLELDENHDNLYAKFDAATVRPGQTVQFNLVWEWRDWRPGATLHIRRCVDVDSGAAVNGAETPPVDSMGANPSDVSVVHPVDEPTFTVMKGAEVRPAVSMPFTLTVPDSAPPGSEVCMRAAILADPVEHRNSPPDYDIGETVCVPVEGAPPSPSPSPSPAPSPSPSPSPSESPSPPPCIPSPSPPESPSTPESPSPAPSESPSPVPCESPTATPAPTPCIPAPVPSPTPSTPGSPSPAPSVAPTTQPSPSPSPSASPAICESPSSPPPAVLGVEELPRTGAPLRAEALAGGLLILLGAAALTRRPKPATDPSGPGDH